MKFVLFVNSEYTLKFNNNTDNFLKAILHFRPWWDENPSNVFKQNTTKKLQTLHSTENFILRV